MASPYSLRKLRNHLWMTKAQLCAKQKNTSPKHYFKHYQQQKWTLKAVRLTHFQKLQLPSVSISFKFVHGFLVLLYLLCYLYLLLAFSAVIFFCFIQFCDRSHVLNVGKFRYTAPVIISGLRRFCVVLWNLWQCQCSSQHALLGVVINNFRRVCSSFSTP